MLTKERERERESQLSVGKHVGILNRAYRRGMILWFDAIISPAVEYSIVGNGAASSLPQNDCRCNV